MFKDEDIWETMADEIHRGPRVRIGEFYKDGRLDGTSIIQRSTFAPRKIYNRRAPLRKMGHYKSETVEAARQLLRAGISLRKVAATVHLSKVTILKIKKEMGQEVTGILCPCGDLAGHKGWCRIRVQESAARQKFLRDKWGKLKTASQAVCEEIDTVIRYYDTWRELNLRIPFDKWLQDLKYLLSKTQKGRP